MVLNMFHGTLQPLAGASRTLSQLAEDGLLPQVLGRRSRRDVPWVATGLDDFGVGFGSFYYPRHLPCGGLDKQTIAGFVEDEQTLELLAELGVDFARDTSSASPHHWSSTSSAWRQSSPDRASRDHAP